MQPLEPRIVITGTGRAGTTLLVQILTDLGFDTGFSPDARIDANTHAGLETRLDSPDAPRIVKSPNLSRRLDEILSAGTANVEHVIIPIRDLDVAAASRVRATKYGSNLHIMGGLFGTTRATKQREALALLSYQLMLTLAKHEVPHTLLLFPRFAGDGEYLYEHLSFLDPTIPKERWVAATTARSQPSLIHEEPLSGRERLAAKLGTAYNRLIGRPIRGVRRVLTRSERR
ncbi:MAG: hypothetical protein ACKO2C_02340 [Actinomycetes bacterium]